MNDLHALAAFKALDEGRLQPVGKGDVVVVTQEARKAAADLLDEVSSLLGDTGIGQVADLIRDGEYDEHDATLAFARFERDILARSRSEAGGTIPADHPLAKGLRTSQKALDEIKRQQQANIAGYLAMRNMPIGSVAADARHQYGRTGAGEALATVNAILEAAPELNPSNYDHDQVCELNAAMVEAYLFSRAILAQPVEPSAPTQRMAELFAAGLSEAQMRAIMALTDQPQIARRGTFSPVAAFNMISTGLVKLGFDKGRMRDTYRLTAKGLAVREVLMRPPEDTP